MKRAVVLLTLGGLLLVLLLPSLAAANDDPYCYAVGNPSYNNTRLVRIDKFDFNAATNETNIGSTGTEKTDSIAFQPGAGVLFGVNTLAGSRAEADRRGYLGVYNLATGAFAQRASPIGYGNGSLDGTLGPINLYDISGLSFDPTTGELYASHVRTGSSVAYDALIKIDPATGVHVENAFGPNIDYVLMPALAAYPSLNDVDDIAFDPTDGQLYAIVNNSTVGDRLVKVNKQTGALTDVGAFGIGEVEGMDFDPHGRLWITAGVSDNSTTYYLYEVDKTTGHAANPRLLDNTSNYEALGCLLAAAPAPAPTATSLPPTAPVATQAPVTSRLFMSLIYNGSAPVAPTPIPAPTNTPVPRTVVITYIRYDPAGKDTQGEYVELKNTTSAAINMTDWTLRDRGGTTYRFPGFTLQPGASVRVWNQSGTNTSTNLYWGLNREVWNNSGDTAYLRNQNGIPVAQYDY